ncbi:MAG: ORF6N domain-containing protein [Candidatus Omnitrophota bacterium]|nr:MAG: ORF6N domain-containing protein [Candidatus Omnitrophota bacterium]
MKTLVRQATIEKKIFLIRNHRVMIDRDLAEVYGVPTKALNQAVKRNIKRFPDDFMFSLTKSEKNELVTNCDQFRSLKYSSVTPKAFTEQGVAMLSSVLNSERAIQANIAIMRVFVKMREIVSTHKDLAYKLSLLEKKIEKHDIEIRAIFEAIRRLMIVPEKPKRRIGFHDS